MGREFFRASRVGLTNKSEVAARMALIGIEPLIVEDDESLVPLCVQLANSSTPLRARVLNSCRSRNIACAHCLASPWQRTRFKYRRA